MKNTGAPLSTACKTWALGLQALANVSHWRHRNHLPVLHDHCAALNVSALSSTAWKCVMGGPWDQKEIRRRGPQSQGALSPTPSACHAQTYTGHMEQEGGSARGRWSCQQRRTHKETRKEIFICLNQLGVFNSSVSIHAKSWVPHKLTPLTKASGTNSLLPFQSWGSVSKYIS